MIRANKMGIKLQNGAGIISPSKLRAKLMGMGVTQQKKKKEGSNSNSSRTSPSSSRLEDSQFVNDSLLDVASASIDNNIDSGLCVFPFFSWHLIDLFILSLASAIFDILGHNL